MKAPARPSYSEVPPRARAGPRASFRPSVGLWLFRCFALWSGGSRKVASRFLHPSRRRPSPVLMPGLVLRSCVDRKSGARCEGRPGVGLSGETTWSPAEPEPCVAHVYSGDLRFDSRCLSGHAPWSCWVRGSVRPSGHVGRSQGDVALKSPFRCHDNEVSQGVPCPTSRPCQHVPATCVPPGGWT